MIDSYCGHISLTFCRFSVCNLWEDGSGKFNITVMIEEYCIGSGEVSIQH